MKLYHKKLVLAVFSSLFFLSETGYADTSSMAHKVGHEYRPIAVVNDKAVTPYDLKKRIELVKFLNKIPENTVISGQDKAAVLKTMIDDIIKEQETDRFKVEIKDDRVEAYMKGLAREKNMTYDQFLAKLKSIGIEPEEATRLFSRSFAWRDLIQGRYGKDTSISTYEIAQIVESNLKTGNVQVDYDSIVFPFDQQGEMQSKQQEASAVLERLKKGESFDAIQLSRNTNLTEKDQVKSLAQIPQELHSFILRAGDGEISSIIRTQNGFEIVRLNGKQADSEAAAFMKKSYIVGYLSKEDYSAEKAENLLNKKSNCEDLSDELDDVKEYNFQALGEASEEIRPYLETLQVGQSKIIGEDEKRMKVLSICSTKQLDYYADINPRIRDEIKGRLLDHKLSLKEKEYLRDLRSSAVITIFSSDF